MSHPAPSSQSICVLVDGTEPSLNALHFALSRALPGETIIAFQAVKVTHPMVSKHSGSVDTMETVQATLDQSPEVIAAQLRLSQTVKEIITLSSKSCPVVAIARGFTTEQAPEAVVHFINLEVRNKCAMIFVGRRQRTLLQLGSFSKEILRLSPIPVVVVK